MPRLAEVVPLPQERFGRLSVEGYAGRSEGRHSLWKCRCDCGQRVNVSRQNLVSGNTTSCGCFHKQDLSERSTVHGHSKLGGSSEYESWCAMWARVRAKSGQRFKLLRVARN